MRNKYRSAIYTFTEAQQQESQTIINKAQSEFKEEIITKVLPFSNFKESDELFKNYYYKNPEKPFCETFINPKLSFLMKEYNAFMNPKKTHHLNT